MSDHYHPNPDSFNGNKSYYHHGHISHHNSSNYIISSLSSHRNSIIIERSSSSSSIIIQPLANLLKHKRSSLVCIGVSLLSLSVYNHVLIRNDVAVRNGLRSSSSSKGIGMMMGWDGGGSGRQFVMCERETPLDYFMEDPRPLLHPYNQHEQTPLTEQKPSRRNNVLFINSTQLLPNNKMNNIGNQLTSLLHLFTYSQFHHHHHQPYIIATTLNSWPISTLSQMFMHDFLTAIQYGKEVTAATSRTILEMEIGVRIVVNETEVLDSEKNLLEDQLQQQVDVQNQQREQEPGGMIQQQQQGGGGHQSIESPTMDQMLYYHPPNIHTEWRNVMGYQVFLIQRLFRHYNHAFIGTTQHQQHPNNNYINSPNNHQFDTCSTLHSLFGEYKSTTPYTLVHPPSLLSSNLQDSGILTPLGPWMGATVIRDILKRMGMLQYPIVMLSDGSVTSEIVEGFLFDDEWIGPKLIVLPSKNTNNASSSSSLSSGGGELLTLAILSNVYIGNPSDSSSVFVAKARYALGYRGEGVTNVFGRDRVGEKMEECGCVEEAECVFCPSIMEQFV